MELSYIEALSRGEQASPESARQGPRRTLRAREVLARTGLSIYISPFAINQHTAVLHNKNGDVLHLTFFI